jgi:hypothetical protein
MIDEAAGGEITVACTGIGALEVVVVTVVVGGWGAIA